MGRYSIDGQDTNTQSTTILGLDGTTTARGFIYDLIIGSDATPADNAAEYNLQRFATANGTGTAVTPQPLDAADGAAELDATEAHSTEPTYTANAIMLNFSLNQRATFRWVAAPGGEIVIPATSDSGVGLVVQTIAGSQVNTVATIHYIE